HWHLPLSLPSPYPLPALVQAKRVKRAGRGMEGEGACKFYATFGLTSGAARTTSSLREQLRDHVPFLFQFVDGGIDFCAAEFVDRHTLRDSQFRAVATDRKRADESLVHPIAAVRADADAMPVAARCGFDDG